MSNIAHLGRRFVTSLSRREPDVADTAWVNSHLLDGERALWRRMSVADRRHSITVARRFADSGGRTRDEIAAALLHDVGKLDAGLGTFGRVVATVIGPRTERFRRYHDHERIGADMLTAAGSSAGTVALVLGEGPAAAALRAADDI
jgi:hypothetical protein